MHLRHSSEAMHHLAERQRRTIEHQHAELMAARERIRGLEDALRKACEYADVCRHNPANELLGEPPEMPVGPAVNAGG